MNELSFRKRLVNEQLVRAIVEPSRLVGAQLEPACARLSSAEHPLSRSCPRRERTRLTASRSPVVVVANFVGSKQALAWQEA